MARPVVRPTAAAVRASKRTTGTAGSPGAPAPPAAAARQLSDHLPRVIVLSVAISVGSVLVGLYLSFYGNWASGATIVLVQTAVFLVTLLVAPRRAIGAAGAV